jgi:hypothetical protein
MIDTPLTMSEATAKMVCFGEPDTLNPHRGLYVLFQYFNGNPRAQEALLRDHRGVLESFLDSIHHLEADSGVLGVRARMEQALALNSAEEVIDTLAWFHGRWLIADALNRLHPEVHWGTVVNDTVRCTTCMKMYLNILERLMEKPHVPGDDSGNRFALQTYIRLYEIDVHMAERALKFSGTDVTVCDLCGVWHNMPKECQSCGAYVDIEEYPNGADKDLWVRCLTCGEKLTDDLLS